MKRRLGTVLVVTMSLAASGIALRTAKSAAKKTAEKAVTSAEVLDAHNRERQKAGVPPLTWDSGLAKLAGDWARHLCRGGRSLPSLEHRKQHEGSPGENLWAGATTEPAGYSIDEAVKRWAEEVQFYDAKSGACRGGVCGHYTQLVWRNTTQVGCGSATCPAAGMHATVWVCNYRPAGNFIGERPF